MLPRLIVDNDDEKLRLFYNEVYGKNHILNNPIHHNWQFKENPFNKLQTRSVVIIEENGEIISHIGLFPVELKILNDVNDAFWHISFYTLEKYRGKGLGSKIIEFSSQLVEFTMVLSGSEGTKKIYLNQGGKYFGDLNRYIAILDKKRIEQYTKEKINKDEIKISKENKFHFNRIASLDDGYDLFWKKVKVRYPITVNRTRKYLSWRYLNHPLLDYHFMILTDHDNLLGYAVLRFENSNEELKAARIVDLIVFEGFEDQLLQHIINYCQNKADFIDFFCTGSYYKNSLEKAKFFNNLLDLIRIPTVFNPINLNRRPDINFFYKYRDSEIANKKELNDINNWYFVKGDSDQDRAN